jgi:hypothetical protein
MRTCHITSQPSVADFVPHTTLCFLLFSFLFLLDTVAAIEFIHPIKFSEEIATIDYISIAIESVRKTSLASITAAKNRKEIASSLFRILVRHSGFSNFVAIVFIH